MPKQTLNSRSVARASACGGVVLRFQNPQAALHFTQGKKPVPPGPRQCSVENCELSPNAKRQSGGAETDVERVGLGVARAGIEQLRGDAEGAAKQVRVGAVKAGKA